MTNYEKEYIKDCIEEKGFDYCFTSYSNFEDIEDKEFHELRLNFLHARDKLDKYINTKQRSNKKLDKLVEDKIIRSYTFKEDVPTEEGCCYSNLVDIIEIEFNNGSKLAISSGISGCLNNSFLLIE